MSKQSNCPKIPDSSNQSDLDEIILRLARYANTLTPYKLDVPIDPLTADGLAEAKQLIIDWHQQEIAKARIGAIEELENKIDYELSSTNAEFNYTYFERTVATLKERESS